MNLTIAFIQSCISISTTKKHLRETIFFCHFRRPSPTKRLRYFRRPSPTDPPRGLLRSSPPPSASCFKSLSPVRISPSTPSAAARRPDPSPHDRLPDDLQRRLPLPLALAGDALLLAAPPSARACRQCPPAVRAANLPRPLDMRATPPPSSTVGQPLAGRAALLGSPICVPSAPPVRA